MRTNALTLLLIISITFALTGCGDKTNCEHTCESRGYECGSHVICSTPENCGTCANGQLCVKGTCEEMSQGNTYFVSLDGDDANPGTIQEPWATFPHAILQAKPGDTVYIRGGVYYHNDSFGGDPPSGVGYSGTKDAWIKFWNYPGERPIFDFTGHEVDPYTGWTGSIGWNRAQYIHLRGFTVRNVHQTPVNLTRKWKPHSEGHGLSCTRCANFIYENIVVHDVDGRGFQHWTGAWNGFDAQYAVDKGYQKEYQVPEFESDTTYFINCDAYNLYDRYAKTPGNAADGWKIESYYGNTFIWEGCRAWNYSDDGFDPHGSGTRIFRNNWAMPTDKYEGLSDDWSPEANGYKTTAPLLNDTGEHFVIFDRNIAAFGTGTGFTANLGLGRNPDRYPQNTLVYNNLAYKMGIGFGDGRVNEDGSDKPTSTYHNNIAYDAQSTEATGQPYEVYLYRIPTIESHNTWIGHPRSGDWWWKYNPEINVNDDDFISLDYNELAAPRRSDFTLPDISFGKLAPSSDLIDAGKIIPGYHCDTPGRHDEDCVEWAGKAPDLGPFEYGLEPEIICRGEETRICSWENGIGLERRTCVGPGDWSLFGACEFYRCYEGYEWDGQSCVIAPGEWSGELMYNGGFESSARGWTSTSDDWEAYEYRIWGWVIIPKEGHYTGYINGKSSEETYIYQDVNLTDYAAHIDQERVIINASGWARSFKASIKFIFLDQNKNNITTALDTSYIEQDEWWSGSISEEPIPQSTRYVRVWANAYHPFTDRAGFIDAFSVKVKVVD